MSYTDLKDHNSTESLARLVLIGGYAGSGKTTVARMLSSKLGWAVLDKDVMTSPLAEQLLISAGSNADDRHSSLYTSLVRPLEYECLLAVGLENVAHRVSSILCAPFLSEFSDRSWLLRMSAQCADSGGSVSFVWVQCDQDVMAHRVKGRDVCRDRWKLANWDEYMKTVDISFRPAGPHLVIDTSGTSEDNGMVNIENLTTQLLGHCGPNT